MNRTTRSARIWMTVGIALAIAIAAFFLGRVVAFGGPKYSGHAQLITAPTYPMFTLTFPDVSGDSLTATYTIAHPPESEYFVVISALRDSVIAHDYSVKLVVRDSSGSILLEEEGKLEQDQVIAGVETPSGPWMRTNNSSWCEYWSRDNRSVRLQRGETYTIDVHIHAEIPQAQSDPLRLKLFGGGVY